MSCDCGCITFLWKSTVAVSQYGYSEYEPSGTFEGCTYYRVDINGTTYFIFNIGGNWQISLTLGGISLAQSTGNITDCPFNTWEILDPDLFTYNIFVGECGIDQCCFAISFIDSELSLQFQCDINNADGIYNGQLYWQFNGTVGCYEIRYAGRNELDQCVWELAETKCGINAGLGIVLYQLVSVCDCPISQSWIDLQDPETKEVDFFATAPCGDPICVPIEDRHQRKYDAIKLPEIFEEQNRGWKGCCTCEPMLTLASPDPETWKNDVTSAWIKLSDPTDVVTFKLEKNGVATTYTPSINPFINEPDAYYTTINWIDVLNSDGAGCYELKVEYNISGAIGEFIWGAYNLKPFTIENALKTARIRVKFNLQQQIEGINFTGTNVEDTIRFFGFIGERQPNMEIDNLIYQDRKMKTVVRENLNTYTITTDPCGECLTTKLTDLYLLSENEMFVSDHNAHNHSYRYLDLPVVVQESPEINYLDILQRKAILTCEIGDRSKNKRTFY